MNRRRMEISLGLLVVATLGILAYIALQMGHLKGLAQSIRVQVLFDNAAGLVEGASVKVAGVQVGRVEQLTVDFDKARATLLIDPSAGIRTDARVAIRARSLLGEKYAEILPQSRTAPPLEDGGELPAQPVGLEIDQVLNELAPMMKGLDVEQVGPLLTDLRSLVGDNRQAATEAMARLNALLGRLETLRFDDPAAQADLKGLVRNLRQASEALPGLMRETDRSLETVAQKAGPLLDKMSRAVDRLEPTLEALPGTVEQLTTTMVRVDRVLGQLEPLLTRIDTVDYSLVQKLLRDEGLLIRLKPQSVEWERAGRDETTPESTPAPPRERPIPSPAPGTDGPAARGSRLP